ncbi:hypothetical protein CY35_12G027600 [Sphagnum magellanicum]|nr:hypothetical protein CY35_12G027600 [Sphagnum magellanicum]
MAMKTTVRIAEAHHLPLQCCCYNYDRNEVFSGAQDCLIKVWDIESGRQLRVQEHHTNWVMDLLYVAAPVKMLFSCSLDGNVLAWNERGKLLQVVEFGGPVYCLAWDSKQRQLIAGGRGAIQLLKVKFLEFIYCLCYHDDTVQAICCSDKGKVFSTGVDKAICIFDSDRPEETIRKVKFCHEGGITAATFDIEGKWLVTGAYDGTVKIWSQEGHCLDTFSKITDCVTSIAYITSTRTYWITGRERSSSLCFETNHKLGCGKLSFD